MSECADLTYYKKKQEKKQKCDTKQSKILLSRKQREIKEESKR